MDSADDWYGLFFGLGFLILVTIVLVVILIQVGAFTRARIARREQAQEQAMIDKYESLAGRSAQHEETTSAELATIRERLDSIETMLREVE